MLALVRFSKGAFSVAEVMEMQLFGDGPDAFWPWIDAMTSLANKEAEAVKAAASEGRGR